MHLSEADSAGTVERCLAREAVVRAIIAGKT